MLPPGSMPICVPESAWFPEPCLLPPPPLPPLLPPLLLSGIAEAILFRSASKLLSPVIAFHIAPDLPLNTTQRKKAPLAIRASPRKPPPPPLLVVLLVWFVTTPFTEVLVVARLKPIKVGL